MAAMWLNFDKIQVLTMLTLPKTDVLIPFHLTVSFLALSIAFFQFISKFSRSGLSFIPSNLNELLLLSFSKGVLVGCKCFLVGPNITYFVFPIFIVSPDICLKDSSKGKVFNFRERPRSQKEREIISNNTKQLLAEDKIEPSTSPHNFQLVVVNKKDKDGKVSEDDHRVCVNFCP